MAARVNSPAPKKRSSDGPVARAEAATGKKGVPGFFDGAGAAAMKGVLFPFLNIYDIVYSEKPNKVVDEKGEFSGGKLQPYPTKFAEYVGVQAGSIFKIAVAILAYKYTVDFEAASQGWDWGLGGWEMQIVYRDLFLMVAVAGGVDWLLYFSPWKDRNSSLKFNKKYPAFDQFHRDFFWTTHATLLASLQEILLTKWWASGNFTSALFGTAPVGETSVPWDTPFFGNEYTPYFILWTMTMLYWRIVHFWAIHRCMHPWWNRKNGLAQGDVGAFLYRYVHSHHHKSYNPTAFSGFSMTPVESISYISAALIPLLFRNGCHPWIHLYTKIDLIVGAQVGHSGFDDPGGGSYYHQLHHAHFECNYGDAVMPVDWLLGTFEDGSSYSSKKK